MPDYSIRVFQLNFYIKKFMPDLFYHFKKHNINSDMFFSKWILTIFACYLPFSTLAKVWDIFFIDGWKAIFKLSMCFLKELYSDLIKMDLNEISKFFRVNFRTLHRVSHISIDNYSKFEISNKNLRELKEAFFLEQVERKIDVKIKLIYNYLSF